MKRVRNLSGLAAMAFLDAMRTIWAGESIDMTPGKRKRIDFLLESHPRLAFKVWALDDNGDAALFMDENDYNEDPVFVDWVIANADNPDPRPPSAPAQSALTIYDPEEISRALVAGMGRIRKRMPEFLGLGQDFDPEDFDEEGLPTWYSEHLPTPESDVTMVHPQEFYAPHQPFFAPDDEDEDPVPTPDYFDEKKKSDDRFYLDPHTPESDFPKVRFYNYTSPVTWLDFGPDDRRTPEWAREQYTRNILYLEEKAVKAEAAGPYYPPTEEELLARRSPPKEGDRWYFGEPVWVAGEGWTPMSKLDPDDYKMFAETVHGYVYDPGSATPAPTGSWPEMHPPEPRREGESKYQAGDPLYDWHREIDVHKYGVTKTDESGFPLKSQFQTGPSVSDKDRWGHHIVGPEFFLEMQEKFKEKAGEEIAELKKQLDEGEISEMVFKGLVSKIMEKIFTTEELEKLEVAETGWVMEPDFELPPSFPDPGLTQEDDTDTPYWTEFVQEEHRDTPVKTVQSEISPPADIENMDYVIELTVPDPVEGSAESVIKKSYMEADPFDPDKPYSTADIIAQGAVDFPLTKWSAVRSVVKHRKSDVVVAGPYAAGFTLPELREEMKLAGLNGRMLCNY